MSTAAPPDPAPPTKEATSIRAALLPEDLAEFDAGLRRVTNRASDARGATPPHDFIETWWRIAVFSLNPEAHRTARRQSEALLRGEAVPTVDAGTVLSRLLAPPPEHPHGEARARLRPADDDMTKATERELGGGE
ncbi:DUF6247 family protein [Actinocorallia sp. API 0066]|uniref:DUF6247 family protein n=1 Tax=Actinocorallia sp. API 0066 TaxID=2896846 RepID=UPI001E3F17B3|nr:DUF6247 family protein [Actinocorallia sp. API 0066]MCD0451456.1 DUF6247 family protein [Actinocorallia sp. API 0066]